MSSTALATKDGTQPLLPPHVAFFLAGALAGAASRTIVSPLERLKIIMQCQGKDAQYRGVFHGLVKMWQQEGWRGYMRGNGVNVLRIAPYSAVQFTTYEHAKKVYTSNGTVELDTPRRLLAGATAGIASVVSTYPLDLVRSRLSIATATIGAQGSTYLAAGSHLSIWGMTKKVFREEGGIRGLYRGLVPTAVGVAPYVATNFAGYELLKGYLIPDEGEIVVFRKLFCGALAGAISQTLTYPLDVLRRKMQVTGMSNIEYKYSGAIQAATMIVQTEGLKGLYKGLWPNLLKVAPAIGTSFVVYEYAKGALGA